MRKKIAKMIIVVLVGYCIFAPIVSATTAEEWNEQGCRFLESGDCEKAIECFDKAIGLNPNYTDAYLNRGLAYWYLKQNERAIEDFEKVIELNPCSNLACRALNALSEIKQENGDATKTATPTLTPTLTIIHTVLPPEATQAPPFTLTSIDGTTFSLNDYRGEVVVLTLITLTCKECGEEMLELEQLREAYPDIAIITVCVDLVETDEDLRDFKEKYKADWLFARDTDNLFSKYPGYVAATPTIVIITPEGYISFREVEVVPLEDLLSAVESAASGEWAPTPADTSEEWPQIPGFSATLALATIYVLVMSRWLVK